MQSESDVRLDEPHDVVVIIIIIVVVVDVAAGAGRARHGRHGRVLAVDGATAAGGRVRRRRRQRYGRRRSLGGRRHGHSDGRRRRLRPAVHTTVSVHPVAGEIQVLLQQVSFIHLLLRYGDGQS